MNKLNFQKPFAISIAVLCLLAASAQAQAANKAKPAQSTKERLVLMPLRAGEEIRDMLGAMQTALVQGLQQKYVVFSGEDVAQKSREIFNKQAGKKNCDETRCMEDIAIAFQSELIATANVTKIEGGYLLALSIRNVLDNKAIYSNSLPCKGCDAFAVIDKLKELSGAPVAAADSEAPAVTGSGNANDPESSLWGEVQKGNSLDDYQAYLGSYPKGKYVALAKRRIKKQQEQQATETKRQQEQADVAQAQQDQSAWDTASGTATEAGYQAYLTGNPQGRYAALAAARISKLQKEAVKAAKQAGQGPVMVRIPGKNYELGKYEVTQKEWQAVMGNNPSFFKDCGDTCPVENVSWDDIQVFLQKLNTKTGRQYRLPTEAEWEYACYGGGQTEYCGSNDINAVAWYTENSNGSTHPVDQKQANGYGLYDMSGNVYEWLQNLYDESKPDVGRALRGGSWFNKPLRVRAADRYVFVAFFRDFKFGFRLARTLP